MKNHSMPTVSLVKLTQALVFVLLLVVAQYGTTVSAQSASISNANAVEQEPVQEHRKMEKLTRPERCATCDSLVAQESTSAMELQAAQDSLIDATAEKEVIKTAYANQEQVRDDAKTDYLTAKSAFVNAKVALKLNIEDGDYEKAKDQYRKSQISNRDEIREMERDVKKLENEINRLVKKRESRLATLNKCSDKKCGTSAENCAPCQHHQVAIDQMENLELDKDGEMADLNWYIARTRDFGIPMELEQDVWDEEAKREDLRHGKDSALLDAKEKEAIYTEAREDLKKLGLSEMEKVVKDLRKAVTRAEKLHQSHLFLMNRCQSRKC